MSDDGATPPTGDFAVGVGDIWIDRAAGQAAAVAISSVSWSSA